MLHNHPNSIKKSLRLLQIEKMVIILKELRHMKTILDFFNGYKDPNSKEENYQNKPIKKNIAYLKEDIQSLEKEILALQDISDGLKNSESMLFILQYDYIRTQIEDMLRVIQALYNKMQQLFGETLNQYLPYPVLGRRYSNNGIMMYLGNYYREMLKTFSPEHTNKLMLGWNYRTGFQYRIFVNQELNRVDYQDDTYNDYIDLPYWYYDLPILLPSITHEVVHISLRKPTETLQKPYKALKIILKDFFEDTNNIFVQKVQDVLAYDAYAIDLGEVIFCDLISYKTHGVAYLHALFHDILGEKLAKDYLKIIHCPTSKQKSFKLTSNEWYFIQKKDHSILRLHFLLHILNTETPNYEDHKIMKEMLDAMMPLNFDDIHNHNIQGEQGFSKVYLHNHPNFKESYLSVQNYLAQLLIKLKEWEEKNRKDINAIDRPEVSPDFTKLWHKRYTIQKNFNNPKKMDEKKDLVLHQNMFRKEIHTKVSKIKYLEENEEAIDAGELSIIYLLELGKARKDIPNAKAYDIQNLIQEQIKREDKQVGEENTIELAVYGIYDWLTIKKKNSQYDISQKFQELLASTQEEVNINDLKYFKTKQVLMKVHEGIQGKVKNRDKFFSVIFNIEINKKIDNYTCTNGYNKLNKAIDNLAITLSRHKDFFRKAEIYKSLGPKDITVLVQDLASLEALFSLLEEINQQTKEDESEKREGKVLRTFTMLCSDFNNEPPINGNFSIVSYLRISNKLRAIKKGVKALIDSDKMENVTEITGIMDIRIVWKRSTKISEVLAYYNNMTLNAYLTDFQTKIEKVIL